MKRMSLSILTVVAAVFFVACGGPADNKPANNSNANTNTNAAKPTAAAPTKEALVALDTQANEAYIKGDSKFFDGFLSDKFVLVDEHGARMDKAATVAMIAGVKCDIKDGWKLDDPQMAMIDADTYVLSYKTSMDGTCTMGGKTEKAPSPIRSGTVWVRNGDKWQAAFHGENVIFDPKNPPPAPSKAAPKKEEAKKDDKALTNSNAASTLAPAKVTGDANTDALVKIHLSGWEAFKAKDAKKFEEITTANLSNVDPGGGWTSGKDAVIKMWTETMKCEGITKVGVSDGIATALSPTAEILTVKGTSDGTCNGMKNGDLYQTAVYVKEGDAWKLAFMFESMPM